VVAKPKSSAPKSAKSSTTSAGSATTFEIISDREIRMSRVFDAPRDLVFEVCSKAEHIPNWWGPREQKVISCEMDFRVGGKWRFVSKGPDGIEHGFHGVFKEIVPPKKVVQTFNYEGIPPGHESVETAVYEDLGGGKTRLTTTSRYQSKADLDGMVGSGMERGARETRDRLAELLAKLSRR
jgi:uncharacterized protein YndB with AHSA1/START domain